MGANTLYDDMLEGIKGKYYYYAQVPNNCFEVIKVLDITGLKIPNRVVSIKPR